MVLLIEVSEGDGGEVGREDGEIEAVPVDPEGAGGTTVDVDEPKGIVLTIVIATGVRGV